MEQEFKTTSGMYAEIPLPWALGHSEIKICTLADFPSLFYIKYLSIHLEQNVILWLISTKYRVIFHSSIKEL